MGSLCFLFFLNKMWMGLSRVLYIFFKLYFNNVFNWFMLYVYYQYKLRLKLCFDVDETVYPFIF